MKQDHINYFFVGSLVLSMIAILFVVILKITDRNHDTDAYYVVYKQIADLKEGTPVTYGGFQIGNIEEISPIFDASNTTFKLTLMIRSDWQIPRDSIARIVSPGLLSDSQIDIAGGHDTTPLVAGSVIKGKEASNIFAALDTVAHEITDLSNNSIQPLITQLSHRIDNVSAHLDDIGSNLGHKIPSIINSTEQLLGELNNSANQLTTLFDKKNQNHVQRIFENADTLSNNLAALSVGLGNSRVQLDQLINNANTLFENNTGDIRTVMTEVRNSINSVSQNIDTIIFNLEGTSRNFNEFSRKISANPAVLLGGQPPKDTAEELR